MNRFLPMLFVLFCTTAFATSNIPTVRTLHPASPSFDQETYWQHIQIGSFEELQQLYQYAQMNGAVDGDAEGGVITLIGTDAGRLNRWYAQIVIIYAPNGTAIRMGQNFIEEHWEKTGENYYQVVQWVITTDAQGYITDALRRFVIRESSGNGGFNESFVDMPINGKTRFEAARRIFKFFLSRTGTN